MRCLCSPQTHPPTGRTRKTRAGHQSLPRRPLPCAGWPTHPMPCLAPGHSGRDREEERRWLPQRGAWRAEARRALGTGRPPGSQRPSCHSFATGSARFTRPRSPAKLRRGAVALPGQNCDSRFPPLTPLHCGPLSEPDRRPFRVKGSATAHTNRLLVPWWLQKQLWP